MSSRAFAPTVFEARSSRSSVSVALIATLVACALPARALITVGAAQGIQEASGIDVAGSYAYVSGPEGFYVVDISDVTAPVVVGQYAPFGVFDMRSVDVSGGLAYVADRRDGLYVIDVSDPGAPVPLGLPVVLGALWDVAVSGEIAYLADEDGLRIVDVSVPSSPQLLSALPLVGRSTKLDVSGSFVFITDNPHGVRIVDVSDPMAPVEVGLLELASVTNVAVVGDRAYVTGGWASLRIFDVSDPAAPVALGALDVANFYAYGAAPAGETVYLFGSDSLRVIDVSDAEMPIEVGFLSTDLALDCKLVGDLALVAAQGRNHTDGFRIVDITDPRVPAQLAELGTSGAIEGATVVDGIAYVVAHDEPLRMIDVSRPHAPTEVGSLSYGSGVGSRDVEVADGLAYLVGYESGLTVIDVADPTTPGLIGTFYGTVYEDVEVVDGVAFLVDQFDGLRTVDVSDPSTPVVLRSMWRPQLGGDFEAELNGIGISGDGSTAVITTSNTGLVIADVSDPSSPTLLSTPYVVGSDAEVEAGVAYVSGPFTVTRVDISTPSAAFKLDSFSTRSPVVGVQPAGPRAFVATEAHGIRVLDVSDPLLSWEISAYDTDGEVAGLSVASQIAFAGYGDLGLRIVTFEPVPAVPALPLWAVLLGGAAIAAVSRRPLGSSDRSHRDSARLFPASDAGGSSPWADSVGPQAGGIA